MESNYVLLTDKLQGDYLNVFKKAELYSTVQHIDTKSENEMLTDLLDLLLTAQENQKPVIEIIGNDLESFCKSYFSEYEGKKRIRTMFSIFYRLSWVMIIIELLFMDFEKNFFLQSTDISGYIPGVIAVIITESILSLIARPLIFKIKKMTLTLYAVITLIISFVLSIGLLTLLNAYSIDVPVWCTFATCGCYIVVYKTIAVVHRYHTYGTIRKKKQPDYIGFWTMVNQDLPFEIYKRFERINKRREKRGKTPLTDDEFIEKLKREDKQGNIVIAILLLPLLLFVIYQMVTIFINDGFMEGLFFTGILIVVEIPAMFIFKASYNGAVQKRRIIHHCEENNVSFTRYINNLKMKH